jgi:tetratricopeptide (TPR) repeat protein
MKRQLLLGLLLVAPPLLGQEPRLGAIVFPTSGAPAAQPAFIRGVLYLHSFEYAQAAAAFREAERLDPGFAMAYWGEALTYTHPVWNQQNLDSARMALAKLAPARAERLARAPTPRERAYLDAVETLYGEGSKERRDTLYSRAVVKLMEDFPDDAEARSFAALSILGLNQGVRDVSAYMRAAAMVAPVFAANPDHPGAAHYLIHAFDDPIHAPLGLSAARAYIRIAPDAAHAQHMTTHIFLALGMWDETIAQNVIATNQTAFVPGHYTEWLGYGYLQAGRFAESRALVNRVRGNMTGSTRQRAELALMRAQHVVNAEEWTGDLRSWPADASAAPLLAAVDQFARGFAAIRSGDTVAARAAHVELGRWSARLRDSRDSLGGRKVLVMQEELDGLLRLAAGDGAAALATMRAAGEVADALPMDFGPPDIVKPVHELTGEMLLQLGRPGEAKTEFTKSLALAPGRARSLIGLVRSASAAGDRSVAGEAFRMLAANWHAADAGQDVLAALRTIAER